jgi:hypothetical protein
MDTDDALSIGERAHKIAGPRTKDALATLFACH